MTDITIPPALSSVYDALACRVPAMDPGDGMLTIKWPTGTYWDVAWYDIWPEITSDNLEGMKRLHRSYGRRVGWQGSWARSLIEADIRNEKRRGRFW